MAGPFPPLFVVFSRTFFAETLVYTASTASTASTTSTILANLLTKTASSSQLNSPLLGRKIRCASSALATCHRSLAKPVPVSQTWNQEAGEGSNQRPG